MRLITLFPLSPSLSLQLRIGVSDISDVEWAFHTQDGEYLHTVVHSPNRAHALLLQLRSSKEFGAFWQFWQCDTFDLDTQLAEATESRSCEASPIINDATESLANDPSEPTTLADGDTEADMASDSNLADNSAPKKLSKTAKRRRLRKRKSEAIDPEGHEVAEIHIGNSVAYASGTFSATQAIHAKDGYIGKADGGTEFAFLSGSHEEQAAQLNDRAYDLLDPPPK